MTHNHNAVTLEVNFDLWKEVDHKRYFKLRRRLIETNCNYDYLCNAVWDCIAKPILLGITWNPDSR